MDFKLNLALFKSTEESNKKFYGDKYDPSKNYPQYNGNIQLSEMDIIKLCTYLQKAKPKCNDYHPEGVVTVKASGYVNTSKNGLQYLGISIEPDYKTLKEIEEADAGANPEWKSSPKVPAAEDSGEDFIPF